MTEPDLLEAAEDLAKAWRSLRPDVYPPYRDPYPEYDGSKEARLEWDRRLCVVDAASDNYLRVRARSKRSEP
jgi:hypothetical protein